MNVESFRHPVGGLYSSTTEIAKNVAYIRNELSSLAVPQAEQLRIAQARDDFDGALRDVRTEIRNLEDKLGMHPGEPPFDPDIENPDPMVTMGFIEAWLRSEIENMHQLVLHLDDLSRTDRRLGIAYILVAESATNILNAFSDIETALSNIVALRARQGS